MVILHCVGFLVLQVIANLFFKWGGSAPQHYWWGFVFGNLVGITSILFMIGMYKAMPAAAVIAVGTGGTFFLNQIVMYLVYHETLSHWNVLGITLIFCGILLAALPHASGKTPPSEKIPQPLESSGQPLTR